MHPLRRGVVTGLVLLGAIVVSDGDVCSAEYAASVWVGAPSGRAVTRWLVERSGGTVVSTKLATLKATGSWQRLAVTSDAASGGTSLGVEIAVTFSGRWKSYVDDVSLART